MHYRFYPLLFILLLLCSSSLQEGDTRKLLIKALNELQHENSLIKIIPILKKDTSLIENVPIGKPIKEEYFISSPYGSRWHPIDKVQKFHSGIDLVSPYASTIHATAAGVVLFAGIKGGYGKCVIIEHEYGFKTIYAHMTVYYTKRSKKIKKGDIIGFLGSTGKSTGNHLHYEIRKNERTINPENWVN